MHSFSFCLSGRTLNLSSISKYQLCQTENLQLEYFSEYSECIMPLSWLLKFLKYYGFLFHITSCVSLAVFQLIFSFFSVFVFNHIMQCSGVASGPLLADMGYHIGCWEVNLGWLFVEQEPYPLYYFSRPSITIFIFDFCHFSDNVSWCQSLWNFCLFLSKCLFSLEKILRKFSVIYKNILLSYSYNFSDPLFVFWNL